MRAFLVSSPSLMVMIAVVAVCTHANGEGPCYDDSGDIIDGGDAGSHYDCFYSVQCRNGVLHQVTGFVENGLCLEISIYRCAEECQSNFSYTKDPRVDPRSLCKEWLDCRYDFNDGGQFADRGPVVRDCGYEDADTGRLADCGYGDSGCGEPPSPSSGGCSVLELR